MTIKCRICKESFDVPAKEEDIKLWEDGLPAQRAMPYLSADERELLISQTCGPCFDKMFGDRGYLPEEEDVPF